MKIIKYIIVGLVFCSAVALAVWAGIWWALIGGIVALIEAVKATPVVAMDIATSIVRILCTGIIFWITFMAGMVITGLVKAMIPDAKKRF